MTPMWQTLIIAFSRWAVQHKECSFSGEDDVSKFCVWDNSVFQFFNTWQLMNPIARSKIAVTSFTGNALAWWNAHTRQQPRLLVTYDQLIEWLRRELVPKARAGASHLMWHALKYAGDIEKYLQQLSDLMVQHPIDPVVAHSLAAKPLVLSWSIDC